MVWHFLLQGIFQSQGSNSHLLHWQADCLSLSHQIMGFPDGASGKEPKNPPAYAGDMSLIPGSGRSPGGGHGNPLQYSCLESRMSGSLQPHGLQHARLLCPSLSPGVWSNSCPLNQSISSSAAFFSFCLQSSPALGSYLFYKVLNHLSGEKISKMHQMYSKLFSNVILCLKS